MTALTEKSPVIIFSRDFGLFKTENKFNKIRKKNKNITLQPRKEATSYYRDEDFGKPVRIKLFASVRNILFLLY